MTKREKKIKPSVYRHCVIAVLNECNDWGVHPQFIGSNDALVLLEYRAHKRPNTVYADFFRNASERHIDHFKRAWSVWLDFRGGLFQPAIPKCHWETAYGPFIAERLAKIAEKDFVLGLEVSYLLDLV